MSSTVEGSLKCHSERGGECLGLTDSNCSHHWGHDDGEGHSAGDHQVPLVVGDVFAFIAVVDLMEGRRVKRVAVRARKQRRFHFNGAGKLDRTTFIRLTFKMQKAVLIVWFIACRIT